MENLIALPTSGLKGAGRMGAFAGGLAYLQRPRRTALQMLEFEKQVYRGICMPAANDPEFNPAPGAA